MNNINQIEKFARELMIIKNGHDFGHVNRVKNWALKIGAAENYTDLEMVAAAALLHDIGRTQAKKEKEHGSVGAVMAEKYLHENNFFSAEKINEISNAIRFHNTNREGEGQLLFILRDADMMDLFGAVGIMRAFAYQRCLPVFDIKNIKGETWDMSAKDFDQRFDQGIGIGNTIVEFLNFHISCYDNLTTDFAIENAKPLVQYIKNYIINLEKEILNNT